MAKWADYLISKVVYDPNHLMFRATRHEDTEEGISSGTIVDKLVISSDIASGKKYITAYKTNALWKKGHEIKTFRINGEPYIRIDNNKVELDFLGDITELQGYESKLEHMALELKDKTSKPEESIPKSEQEQITKEHMDEDIATAPPPEHSTNTPPPEPNSTNKQAPSEPPPSTRGSLPKDTGADLPQELELLPPDTPPPEHSTNTPPPEPNSTDKQAPSEPPPSPRGSLPKDTGADLPQELELLPPDNPDPEQDDDPEELEPDAKQLAELGDLKSQLAELEDSLTNIKSLAKMVFEKPKDTETPELGQPQPDNPNSDTEPGYISGQKPKVTPNIEKEIVQLKNQSKKLDEMQDNLHMTKPGDAESATDKITAYCVKCKKKQHVKNPHNTVLKNGRHAIQGICTECSCKVFRIIKKQ